MASPQQAVGQSGSQLGQGKQVVASPWADWLSVGHFSGVREDRERKNAVVKRLFKQLLKASSRQPEGQASQAGVRSSSITM